jgi:hypothetical protein
LATSSSKSSTAFKRKAELAGTTFNGVTGWKRKTKNKIVFFQRENVGFIPGEELLRDRVEKVLVQDEYPNQHEQV